MLGFDLDIWDYITFETFAVVLIIATGALAAAVFIVGSPRLKVGFLRDRQ
jgi:hypothetical protein